MKVHGTNILLGAYVCVANSIHSRFLWEKAFDIKVSRV